NGINNAASSVAINAMCDLFVDKPLVVIHRDRDFLVEEELNKWGEEYVNKGMKIFCPPYCDVEAYHGTADHIALIYEINIDQAQQILNDILENKREEFKSKFQ